MKTQIHFLVFFLLAWSACKKDDQHEKLQSLTPVICEAPDDYDMADAALWGNGTPESCIQESLQQLINTGGKIQCNCGSQPFTLVLDEKLIVPNKEVIIDGAGLLTIDGNNEHRIFDVQPAASQEQGTLFAVQNINLVRGLAVRSESERGGAAIYGRAYGSLVALNVTFDQNTGPLNVSDDCGAVHTIVYKEVLFANCRFTNNRAANGPAVGTIGSAMAFVNCSFINNTAVGAEGNAITGGCGGAVYVDGAHQNESGNKYISICGCEFKHNNAGYQAGAVNIIFYQNTGSYAVIDKCTFDDNQCMVDKAGACYLMNGDFSISNCTFSQNNSPAQGGAIWSTWINMSITNCTFWDNSAGSVGSGLGGAIAVSEGQFEVTNCTFVENQAGIFASAVFNGESLTLTNSLFYNNRVGDGYQSNPYGGAVINKETNLTDRGGNLQYPADFTGQYGTMQDYWITSNVMTVNPQIQALNDNGGPTLTMALSDNSPAIGAGIYSGAPETDQRGMPRKNPPDIGAFEWQNP